DKIKGGWAGQTIGVTFGGPYEFRFQGTFIGDYQPLLWYDGYLKKTMLENPGLYDDLYMDLTFVDVFEKSGLNAPVDSFASAYAHAGYMLWHANQAGRYNILNGIKPPQSGHWLNNPHADCIDYQIESDFAGLMSPGMPNTASAISDKIGHIMNYGDGWYGGVYVGALYTLAFTSSDINYIVNEALKTVPRQSEFYQCISDVIQWHKKYPADWKQTWLEVQKKWADDIGCPEGVFLPFNIDAKVNAAYVVIGLLYGGGDFTRTLEITTRCGQDADCNPSSAGGILGTILGYNKIPAYWKQGLKEAEDIDFKYTTMSLNDVYTIGFKHALANIEQNGGSVEGDRVIIKQQTPVPVKFEKSFLGMYPIAKIPVRWSANKDEISFDFEGAGFVLRGDASKWGSTSDYVFQTELYVDDKLIESPKLPVSYTTRRYELAWKYGLPKGKHSVRLKILNPSKEFDIRAGDVLVYSDKLVNGMKEKEEAAKSFAVK
ncbi:MAG: ADP-ribosylglycohydrolase family protein, partial [Flavisolibacter sp.]|nr:ADP-ribosylglycohydrolase family protein [Flavisolibacter sp.]